MESTTMKIILVIVAALLTLPAWALEDTKASREQEAVRYLNATPPNEMLENMADQMAKNLPPGQREDFKELMVKHLDIEALTKVIKESMVKNFTADELRALADFYGSSVGKSAMKKFGTYMADVMPSIQAEMVKARAKANREKK
jgi:hypothetical protein